MVHGETIDAFNPGASDVNGINNRSQIVGRFVDRTGATHGFLDDGDRFTQIDVPKAHTTFASGINDAGWIVGYFDDQTNTPHGFLRDPSGRFQQLDFPDATFTEVLGINNSGELVGVFGRSLETGFAFLADPIGDLAPTPEPTTLLLSGTTLAGLGLARWRHGRRKRQR